MSIICYQGRTSYILIICLVGPLFNLVRRPCLSMSSETRLLHDLDESYPDLKFTNRQVINRMCNLRTKHIHALKSFFLTVTLYFSAMIISAAQVGFSDLLLCIRMILFTDSNLGSCAILEDLIRSIPCERMTLVLSSEFIERSSTILQPRSISIHTGLDPCA